MIRHVIFFYSAVVSAIRMAARFVALFIRSLIGVFIPPYRPSRFFVEARKVGPDSVFLTSLMAFAFAILVGVFVMGSASQRPVPGIITDFFIIYLKDAAPFLTALIILWRVAVPMSIDMVRMGESDQFDLLRVLTIDPVKFLLVPRFLAYALMIPSLMVFSLFFGVIGCFVFSVVFLGVEAQFVLNLFRASFHMNLLAAGFMKAMLYGMVLAVIGYLAGTGERERRSMSNGAASTLVFSSMLFVVVHFGVNTVNVWFLP